MRPSRNQSLIEALGVEIKVRRLELGLSQEDLAGRCELDRPYITLIESGRKQPTISVLHRLAGALEWSLAEMCGRVEVRYQAMAARLAQPDVLRWVASELEQHGVGPNGSKRCCECHGCQGHLDLVEDGYW